MWIKSLLKETTTFLILQVNFTHFHWLTTRFTNFDVLPQESEHTVKSEMTLRHALQMESVWGALTRKWFVISLNLQFCQKLVLQYNKIVVRFLPVYIEIRTL